MALEQAHKERKYAKSCPSLAKYVPDQLRTADHAHKDSSTSKKITWKGLRRRQGQSLVPLSQWPQNRMPSSSQRDCLPWSTNYSCSGLVPDTTGLCVKYTSQHILSNQYPGSETGLQSFLPSSDTEVTVWPRVAHVNSLSLSLSLSKMGTIIPTSGWYCEN